jgi:hypothetical protein
MLSENDKDESTRLMYFDLITVTRFSGKLQAD